MRSASTVYVTSAEDYDGHQHRLKHTACPHCRAVGCLIRHGYLRGYGDSIAGAIQHGWRVFCSNRGHKEGCGRTYAIVLANHLYRRLVDAQRLWKFLAGIQDGASIKQAWEPVASPFCLETGYKLWAAFIRNQSAVRSKLHAVVRPMATVLTPVCQTILHLKTVFPQAYCPVAAFQTAFQDAFLAR
jgi:hypothetical protein